MFRNKNIVTDPFRQFIKQESSSSIIMIISMIIALFIANSSLQQAYHQFWETYTGFGFGDFVLKKHLSHWINDGLMALFFLVIGLEVKREILIGELSTVQKALFPVVGAFGGAIIPALIYVGINFNGGNMDGWGIPMATDIAFALGILALLGSKVPTGLKVFLTSLAVADDMIAVLVIAIFYTSSIQTTYLIYALITIVFLIIMNRMQVKLIVVYLISGAFLWYFFLKSGVHATIAGVILAFFIPTSPKISFNVFARAARNALRDFTNCKDDPNTEILTKCQKKSMNRLIQVSFAAYNPLSRLEYNLHSFSAFVIMPIFAFSNTGITFSSEMFSAITSPESLGIILGLLIGKPLGIFGFIFLSLKLKLISMPADLDLKQIFGASILGGIGLTMSIFISNMAFAGTATLENAKLSILMSSVIAGIVGFIYLKLLFNKR
jgi:NhaA family Na+:H+ antiporter